MSFRSDLEGKLREYKLSEYDRPFDGEPEQCVIFVVGSSPARPLKKPFASYWPEGGFFQKAMLLEDIRPWGPTRRNIEHVAGEAGYQTTLVTNIWVKDSPRENQLLPEHRDTRLFEFLFRRLRPKVVLAHGNEAKDFFEKKCQGVKRNSNSAHAVSFEEHKFLLVCSRHLSHQMGEDEAKAIGRKLYQALASANAPS